jgi:hypothetical protein
MYGKKNQQTNKQQNRRSKTMSQKAEVGNWDEDFKEDEKSSNGGNNQSSSGSRKAVYMDLSKPGNYKVRLVGPHIKCRKHFKPYKAIVQDNEKETDPAWKAGFFPSRRFAVNVIDKTGVKDGETGVLKILEKGPQVFKVFASYKAVAGVDPAGKEGPDFNIKVEIPKKDDKMSTEYTVMNLGKALLSEGEIKMIKEVGLFPLKEIYKSTSSEKMKEMWDALSDTQKIAPKRTPKAGEKTEENKVASKPKEEPIQENMANSPADSGDEELFGGSDGENSSSGEKSGELW